MKKRILAGLVTLLILMVQMPITAQNRTDLQTPSDVVRPQAPLEKADGHPVEETMIGYGTIDMMAGAVAQSNSKNFDKAKELLFAGLHAQAEFIDISDLRITPTDLSVIMQDIRYSTPDLFYVSNYYSYSYISDYVTECYPMYLYSGTELTKAQAFYESEIDRIVEQSGALAVEDDLMQALLLHDYLVSHFSYDLTYSVYDVYGMLTQGTAVCQGYTLLYAALLTECGIESGYAVSEALNHIWNLVKIGENYYHVDATWDDPVSDRYARVCHDSFMLSDTAIASTGHRDWVSSEDTVCSDTAYDDTIFTFSNSAFAYCNGDIYYINYSDGNLCRYIDENTVGSTVTNVGNKWYIPGQPGYYYSGYHGSLVSVDGMLYFNTSSGIGSYDPETDEMNKDIVTVDQTDGGIVGMVQTDERTLSYAIAPGLYDDLTEIRTYVIPKQELVLHPMDVNRDGVLNITDVNDLLMYLADAHVDATYRLDVNDDGYVNIDDLNTVLIALATA